MCRRARTGEAESLREGEPFECAGIWKSLEGEEGREARERVLVRVVVIVVEPERRNTVIVVVEESAASTAPLFIFVIREHRGEGLN